MSDQREREWRFYIDDMIRFAEKVTAYTDDLISRVLSAAASPTTPLCAISN